MSPSLAFLLVSILQPVQDPPDIDRAMGVVDAWLESDFSDDSLLDESVKALLEAGEPAFRALGEVLRKTTADQDQHRAGGLESVITRLFLEYIQREVDKEMVYAGQYDPLAALMPYSGRFYMGLLLNTPDWFPANLRWQVVAPLRDLYPTSPGALALADIQRIAEDERFETESVRVALAYALAQWGQRGIVEVQIASLKAQSDEGDVEDQLFALRSLADLNYQIRDYVESARLHKEFLGRALAQEFPLAPVDYYNAACNFCLIGDLESAFAALEACAELQLSDRVDSSLKLERSLFDEDPEIRIVRGTERFKRIVEKAFGKKDGD